MSDDGIQLSPELMTELRSALKKQDPRSEDDIMAMQYLVAAVGMMLSSVDDAELDKKAVLGELSGFMDHVFDYMESQKAPIAPPPAQEAFGVWKPAG